MKAIERTFDDTTLKSIPACLGRHDCRSVAYVSRSAPACSSGADIQKKKGPHCLQALEFGAEVELVSSGPAYSDKVQRGEMKRAASSSVGSRPSGVNLSTAAGKSRVNLDSNSSDESPVCCESVFSASGPIACANCSRASG